MPFETRRTRWNGHNFQSIRINFLNGFPGSQGTHAWRTRGSWCRWFHRWLRFLGLHVTNSSQQIARHEHERSNLDNTASIEPGGNDRIARTKVAYDFYHFCLFFSPSSFRSFPISGGERRAFFEMVHFFFFFYSISVEGEIFFPFLESIRFSSLPNIDKVFA